MGDAERLHKQANDAREMSVRAVSPIDKATWLHLADDWLVLAREADRREGKQ
jgi:hypothetical protein